MSNKLPWFTTLCTICLTAFLLLDGRSPQAVLRESGAGRAMDAWVFARTYPDKELDTDDFVAAFQQQKLQIHALHRLEHQPAWQPIGPWNVGGRTLCLAFDPQHDQIVYAGSASGGLWKSESGGKGKNAWKYLPTGYPVLSVSAIAVDPVHPQTLYLGTGEVYNHRNSYPGVANRMTRGSYGIGILKSTDGGKTWKKSLDWSMENMRGVQKIVFNPLNSRTLYAATTEGLYRSSNAGKSWECIHDLPMAVDIAIHAADTSTIFVSHGNLDSQISGIFRSTDNGHRFYRLYHGLPVGYTGKAMLAISPSNPRVLYASVANSLITAGLYRSEDGGYSWKLVNEEDVPKWQGWYSHDVAVHPQQPNTIIYVGIDAWKSTDGGKTLNIKSDWRGGFKPGPKYIHADIHAVYYHPAHPEWIYYASDGGVFKSEDGGETFMDCNHGYQTSQFYANFSNSTTRPDFAIGGMQDNSSVIYRGKKEWWRVLGGDGMSTAINPENDRILYGSYQYLGLMRSRNGGHRWEPISPPVEQGADVEAVTNFAAPYEIAPSSSNVLYAGRNYLYHSTDFGSSWKQTTARPLAENNPILSIAVGPKNPQLVYVGTSALNTPPAKVLKSTDGGRSWADLSAHMPDRLPMDIAIEPGNPQCAYVVFSGFDNSHVCKTENGGKDWYSLDNGLPNVPANSILIDPRHPSHLYLGNDLGVYFSSNGGASWEPFTRGLPEAIMAMHLSDSPSNRKIRLASHGHGVWEVDYVRK